MEPVSLLMRSWSADCCARLRRSDLAPSVTGPCRSQSEDKVRQHSCRLFWNRGLKHRIWKTEKIPSLNCFNQAPE